MRHVVDFPSPISGLISILKGAEPHANALGLPQSAPDVMYAAQSPQQMVGRILLSPLQSISQPIFPAKTHQQPCSVHAVPDLGDLSAHRRR